MNIIYTLQMPQNLLRNIFLIWEICSQIKKILDFSQNKKNKLAEKNFLVPSARKFDWN